MQTQSLVCHAAFWSGAFGSSALLENRISKDFLSTLIQCVWELYALIKPLIIAHLAHYSRVKLIKTFLQAGRGGGPITCSLCKHAVREGLK